METESKTNKMDDLDINSLDLTPNKDEPPVSEKNKDKNSVLHNKFDEKEVLEKDILENEEDKSKGESKRRKTNKIRSRKVSPGRGNISPTQRKRSETTRSISPTYTPLTNSETSDDDLSSDSMLKNSGSPFKKNKKKNSGKAETTPEIKTKKTNKTTKSKSFNGLMSSDISKSDESKIDSIPESSEDQDDSQQATISKTYSTDDMKSQKKEKKHFTVEELTDLLIQSQESYLLLDKNFVNTYLLTHQYFIESPLLLTKLIDFYKNPPAHILDDERQLSFHKMRIVNVLKKLIEFRYYDLKNENEFFTKLQEFVCGLEKGEESEVSCSKLLATSMDKNSDFIRQEDDEVPPPSPIVNSNNITNTNFVKWVLEFNPVEFARQQTIKDYNLFKAIKLEDLYFAKFNHVQDPSNSVIQLIQRFNELSTWVSSSILSIPNKRSRVQVLSKHIQVMDELRKLQNFHGMMAYYSSLNIIAIKRLKKTWKEVSGKCTTLLNAASKFFDNSQDFKTYRDFLKTIDPPCVPYFGFISGDLTFIEEFPTYIKGKKVNWNKMVLLSKCFVDVLRFQRTKYNLQEIPGGIGKNSGWSFDEDTMLKMSYSLEQDESSSTMDSPGKTKTKSKKDKKTKKTFADLYGDKVLLAQFRNFMTTKLSSENILFWEDVHKFKEINFLTEKNKATAEAKEILSKYIEGNSDDGDYTIGLPQQMKNYIIKRMESSDIDQTIFDEAQMEIEHSVLVTHFSDFLKYEEE